MIGNAVAGFKCAGYKPAIPSALLLAIFSACAWSQTQLATISGTITDPSGAVIPAGRCYNRKPEHWLEARSPYWQGR